jgi:hypothetical protein
VVVDDTLGRRAEPPTWSVYESHPNAFTYA